MSFDVFCDGGSRGNPGEAAYGFVVYHKGKIIYREGKRLGIKTNNFAEYTSVLKALRWILNNFEIKTLTLNFYMDSSLVVNQLNGNYRVKSESIRNLFLSIKNLINKNNLSVAFTFVPREKNTEADKMVNIALDNY